MKRIFELGTSVYARITSDEIIISLIKFTTKTVNVAKIDDKEEYLNINETTIQVKINNKDKDKERAIIIPKYVATPLPPLNFNQTG